MGDLTKFSNMGKQSPGPIYNYKDEVKYNKVRLNVWLSIASWLGFRNFRERC